MRERAAKPAEEARSVIVGMAARLVAMPAMIVSGLMAMAVRFFGEGGFVIMRMAVMRQVQAYLKLMRLRYVLFRLQKSALVDEGENLLCPIQAQRLQRRR